MKKMKKLITLYIIFGFTFALICVTRAQVPAENMEMFFDSDVPGIRVQVNATAETRPAENITVMLSLKRQTTVYVENFNLSIFGFLNGTDKVLMANITDNDFSLSDTPKGYNLTFEIPEQVWDVTYGEIVLTYRADVGGLELRFPQIVCGFTMTHVENVYLKEVEEQLRSLTSTYEQLNQTFWECFGMNLSAEDLDELNRTYWEYQQNYTSLQGTLNELNNTRQAVIILAITTVFFVATTIYLVMRKPRQYW